MRSMIDDLAAQPDVPMLVDAHSDLDLEFWSLVLDASPMEIRHAAAMVGRELSVLSRYVRMQRKLSGSRPH